MTLPFLSRESLAAWCVVPYDSERRDAAARARMLGERGIGRLVWDWRDEHVPLFDAELDALEDAGIELAGLWAPAPLSDDTAVVDVIAGLVARAVERGHAPQLWSCYEFPGPWTGPEPDADETAALVADAVHRFAPIATLADEHGLTLGIYNHMGWSGEPEHQLLIADALQARGHQSVGLVYQLHHGHTHMDRFARVWPQIAPRVIAFGLNGMIPGAAAGGRKIHPYGHGPHDVEIARVVLESRWTGLTTVLGHTMEDAAQRLADNLDGVEWVRARLAGEGPEAPPAARIPEPVWPH